MSFRGGISFGIGFRFHLFALRIVYRLSGSPCLALQDGVPPCCCSAQSVARYNG
jgi:hypothetical protein